MSKQPPDELGAFVDAHPTTAVLELLGLMSCCGDTAEPLDRDVFRAYLQRVAACAALPDSLRSIADELVREWDIDAVGPPAAAMPPPGLLH